MKVLDAVLTGDDFALTAPEVKPNMSPDNADTSSLQVLLYGLIQLPAAFLGEHRPLEAGFALVPVAEICRGRSHMVCACLGGTGMCGWGCRNDAL